MKHPVIFVFVIKEEVLQVYERYNYLESYNLLSDTALVIVVTDTSRYYYESKRLDTMMVKLP
jgi:hypothetical protein